MLAWAFSADKLRHLCLPGLWSLFFSENMSEDWAASEPDSVEAFKASTMSSATESSILRGRPDVVDRIQELFPCYN